MDINPVLFFDLAISLFVVSIALAAMAMSYTRVLKKLISHQEKYDEIIDKINQKEFDLLEDARKKSVAIIEDATLKAQKIITEGDAINQNVKKLLEKTLGDLAQEQAAVFQKTSEDFLIEYKKQLISVQDKTIEIASKVSKNIEVDTLEEIKEFDDILAKETVSGQKIVGQKIEEEFTKAQKEVVEYKAKMLDNVNNQIYELLANISKSAIGRSLPVNEHEKLIIEALEKAKKDGLSK